MQLKEECFLITHGYEPLDFLRRSGNATIHSSENYERLHDEEVVLKLKEMGVTLFRFHFHKGLGYALEREDRERARMFIKLCHKHDLKVESYIQFGTLMPEGYSAEEPDYDHWIQYDEQGKPITLLYSHQNFRNHPCLNQPGYWEHLKKIIKEAIVDCGTDAIGFDNVSGAEEPDICHCDVCKKAFVEFLKQKYPTKDAAKDRFGHSTLERITPPVWNYYNTHFNLTEIKQPVLQEWAEFRALSLKRRVDEMYQVCKSLNPDVLVEINAFRQTGQNTTFTTGLYIDDISTGCDAFWSEMEPDPGYEEGVLHHKVRAFKNTRALDKLLFTTHFWDGSPGSVNNFLLAIAESMVFQYGSINGLRLIKNYKPIANTNLPYMPLLRFSQANREIYRSKPVPFVHVYESRASLSYSNFDSHYANILMQQLLLREKIPYAILHNLDNIEDCKTIILPGTMCLHEDEIDMLVAFVKRGGGLVLTGNAGDFDENYRGLEDRSLKAKLGIAPKLSDSSGLGKKSAGLSLWSGGAAGDSGAIAVGIGEGKVAAFPRLTSKHDFETYDWTHQAFEQAQIWVKPQSWEAPENMHQIADAIRWTLHYELPVVLSAPEPVVCELAENGNHVFLHLLNYDTQNTARAITATFRKKITSATLLIPQTGESKELKVLHGNSIVVDEVNVYAIVKTTI